MACYRIRDYVIAEGGYRVVEREPTPEEARELYERRRYRDPSSTKVLVDAQGRRVSKLYGDH